MTKLFCLECGNIENSEDDNVGENCSECNFPLVTVMTTMLIEDSEIEQL